MQNIIDFRHELHKYPELSGQEFATQKRIINFVRQFSPDEILPVARTGLAIIYKGIKPGKTLIFRADIDAFPIQEANSGITYYSLNKGVAHLCGHDGHTAILLALAKKLSENKPETGRIVLLFQPAEEIGQGAKAVLEDKNFQKIEPDYVIGFHNLPGLKKGTIFMRENTFAAASRGIIIRFQGKTAHAAEPEKGINPAFAVSKMVDFIRTGLNKAENYADLAFATIVHIRLGEPAFGTSPGNAELMLTLRSFNDADMQTMLKMLENKLTVVCKEENINFSISQTDIFPALKNDKALTEQIYRILQDAGIPASFLETPFCWSEDFAYFSQKYPSVYFGIGAGEEIPNLHNPNYDFPDELIDIGANVLEKIIKVIQ